MVDDPDVPINSVKRAFDILESVRNNGVVGVTAVANDLDLPRSSVHGYLDTLTRIGYVERIDQKYRLDVGLFELGDAARRHRPIFDVGRSHVDYLAEVSGERANLLVESGGRGIPIYSTLPNDGGELASDPGKVVHMSRPQPSEESSQDGGEAESGGPIALHSTATGKAMLAALPADTRRELIESRPLARYTERTIVDEERLRSELDTVTERGYAVDDGERVPGLRCVAAPIVHDGTVGAIGVSGPAQRITGRRFRAELPERVQSVAEDLRAELAAS